MKKTKHLRFLILAAVVLSGIQISCALTESIQAPTPTPTNTPVPTATPIPELNLGLDLQQGEVYSIRITTDQDLTMTAEGQEEEMKQKFGFGYSYTVTNVDAAGNASVDITYDWVLFSQESALGTTTYDSSNPPAEVPPESIGFAALVGSSFSVQFSPSGEVLQISGIEEMYEEMFRNMDIADEALRDQLEQSILEQFSDEGLREQMKNLVFEFPQGPLFAGDTWTQTVEGSGMMPMILENTYTLREFDDKIAVLDVRSTITPNPDAPFLDFGFFQIGYAISGEQEGVVEIDIATGLSSSMITQLFSGEMILVFEGEELIVPISGESIVRMEMTKVE